MLRVAVDTYLGTRDHGFSRSDPPPWRSYQEVHIAGDHEVPTLYYPKLEKPIMNSRSSFLDIKFYNVQDAREFSVQPQVIGNFPVASPLCNDLDRGGAISQNRLLFFKSLNESGK
jgi:hypothetical protein